MAKLSIENREIQILEPEKRKTLLEFPHKNICEPKFEVCDEDFSYNFLPIYLNNALCRFCFFNVT